MTRLSLSLLGPPEIALDGQLAAGFDSDKVRALLIYLAVEADHAHRRETLAALLWPDHAEDAARSSLRNALANLRTAIGDRAAPIPFLIIARDTIRFNPASDHWLDLAALSPQATDPTRLEEATARYRGDFLEGFSLPDSAPFESWALLVRERLRQRLLDVLALLAAEAGRRGDYAAACRHAERRVALAPWEEEAHRQLMRLLAESGQRGAALVQYENCRRALQQELDVTPSAETVQLYERIRDGLVGGSLEPHPSHIPAPLLPLIGREAELDALVTRLRDPGCRLLTLLGPGGIGKTHLSIAAAARLVDAFAHGVHLVPLSAVDTPDGVVVAIAQAVGFSFYPQAGEHSSPKQQLLGYLQTREALLILDTYEHLLASAGLVAEMLEAAPRVKALVTTRARLNVPGESVWTLAALACPPSSDQNGAPYAAMQLFLESAHRARPGYAPRAGELADIGQICRALGGVPLAILLAASWLEVLSPAEIAAQLLGEDGQALDLLETEAAAIPERQRSMRAVFDGSWRLLSDWERRVLGDLSVFHGGCTREAARAVAGATPHDLLRLVDRSLLQRQGEGRYGMQDLLHRYATERLAAEPGAVEAARDRHAAYFASAMQSWDRDLRSARQDAAMREIEADWANVRDAWEWALARGRPEWLGPVVLPLRWYYYDSARWPEAEAWFRRGAERLRAAPLSHTVEYCRALAALLLTQAFFANQSGRPLPAPGWLEECEALLREAEQAGGDAHRERAIFWQWQGEMGRARAEARAAGDRHLEANVVNGLAQRCVAVGRLAEARALFLELLSLWRETGAPSSIRGPLLFLCGVALRLGRLEEAEQRVAELAAHLGTLRDRRSVGAGRITLAMALQGLGRFAEARALCLEMVALWEELDDRYNLAFTLRVLGEIEMHLGRYREARATLQREVEIAESLGFRADLVSFACGLLALAALAAGDTAEAERAAQQCADIYRQIGQADHFWPHLVCGHVAAAAGRLHEARREWRSALRTYPTIFISQGCVWEPLSGVAAFLARCGQAERAVEIYGSARRYPFVARSRWHEDICGSAVAAAAASLSPEARTVAEERGQARDWQATVAELLAEMGE